MPQSTLQDDLVNLINQHGVHSVVRHLALICGSRGDKCRTIQTSSARAWRELAEMLFDSVEMTANLGKSLVYPLIEETK